MTASRKEIKMEKLITFDGSSWHYHDKNGTELHEGDTIVTDEGEYKTLYETEDGELGVDATNPKWIISDRAYRCEMGIYPLNETDCHTSVKSTLEYEYKGEKITYDRALYMVIAHFGDCDISRDMLKRANNIRLKYNYIYVTEEVFGRRMCLMAGLENFVPDGYVYDEDGNRIKEEA